MFEVSVHVWMRLHDTDYKNVVNCSYKKMIDFGEKISEKTHFFLIFLESFFFSLSLFFLISMNVFLSPYIFKRKYLLSL